MNERKRKSSPIQTILTGLIAIIIVYAATQSQTAAKWISILPFSNDFLKLVGASVDPAYQSRQYNAFAELYKYVMVSLTSNTFSWMAVHMPILSALISIILPQSEYENDRYDFSVPRRGVKDLIRGFIIGSCATVAASLLYEKFIERQEITNVLPLPFPAALISITVLVLLLGIGRTLLSGNQGGSFVIFSMRNTNFKVGFPGFVIYTIIKDAITTFFVSLTLLIIYALFRSPEMSGSFLTILIMLLGIQAVLGVVFM